MEEPAAEGHLGSRMRGLLVEVLFENRDLKSGSWFPWIQLAPLPSSDKGRVDG